MMWIKALMRVLVFWPLAIILLPLPTLYATLRKLDRLPWGLDPLFGCMEDGWNGTGCDPMFPRKYWINVDGKTIQGWWPDHLGLIWDDLAWYDQWWLGYKWCALRNFAWNSRLLKWFGISIHFRDIKVVWFEESPNGEATYIWVGPDGKQQFKKRRLVFGKLVEYGYEFYPWAFDIEHPWYAKVRSLGYTFDVTPFKNRSIPSFRLRRKT
jgi:hypothetical protein